MTIPSLVVLLLALSLCPGDCRFIIEPLSFIRKEALTVDMCTECRRIVQLSANMISTRDTKETVYVGLHTLCQRFPHEQAAQCDSQLKTYLPKMLQQTPGHLKPAETCAVIGLCPAHKGKDQPILPHYDTDKDKSSSALGPAISSDELYGPTCSLCLFVIRKLETLLPQNMTEDSLRKLMGEVCDLLPESYKESCDDFVTKYGDDIVEFLMSSAAPHTICTLLHLCFFKEKPLPAAFIPSDCESCRTLTVLSRLYLSPNSTVSQTSSFLQSVCAHHPDAIPKCEAFTKIFGPRLQRVLGNQLNVPHACERADLCVAMKKMEPVKPKCTKAPYC